MTTTRYRKKPIVIDAILWTGDNILDVMTFMHPQEPVYVNNLSHMKFTNADDVVGIQTLEGLVVASKGDWILRGVAGELYPCKPDIFAATYEAVGADAASGEGGR
jgi:hypothetical protein